FYLSQIKEWKGTLSDLFKVDMLPANLNRRIWFFFFFTFPGFSLHFNGSEGLSKISVQLSIIAAMHEKHVTNCIFLYDIQHASYKKNEMIQTKVQITTRQPRRPNEPLKSPSFSLLGNIGNNISALILYSFIFGFKKNNKGNTILTSIAKHASFDFAKKFYMHLFLIKTNSFFRKLFTLEQIFDDVKKWMN
ncbi:hypothetical protein ACJX0J_024423, partial [Zea mays]